MSVSDQSEPDIVAKVRALTARAQALGSEADSFDSIDFVRRVREALAANDWGAARSLVDSAEAELGALELNSSSTEARPAARAPLAVLRDRASQALGVIRRHPFAFDLVVIAALGLVEAAILVLIQIQSVLAFSVYSLSISVYNQVLFSASHSPWMLYYTANLPGGNNGQFLSVHFSPFLFAIAPIYYLAPGIPTVLAVKQVALALGALPAYALARAKLSSRKLAWLVAIVYLTTPLITGIDWVSFDPESFLPLTMLCAFYFFEVGRLRWFLVSCVAALSIIESAAPMLGLFAAVALVLTFVPYSRRADVVERRMRKFASWALIASVASLAVSLIVVTKVFASPGGGAFGSAFTQDFSVLGATSIPEIPFQIIFHPGHALAAISYEGSTKLIYILLLFGCLGFLPLFAPLRYLMPVAAWVGLALVSNSQIYFALSNHDLGYPVPFLIAGMITGIPRLLKFGPWLASKLSPLKRLAKPWRSSWSPYAVASVLVVGLVVTVSVSSPWLSTPVGAIPGKPAGIAVPEANDTDLSRVLSYLPASASVLTTGKIFPAVSNRRAAFLEPGPGANSFLENWSNYNATSGGGLALQRVTSWYLNMSRYVLLDYALDEEGAITVLYYGNNLTGYGVKAADGGAVLYERGWTEAPALWIPEAFALSARQNTTNSSTYTTTRVSGVAIGVYVASFVWNANLSGVAGTLKVKVNEIPSSVAVSVRWASALQTHYNIAVKTQGKSQTLADEETSLSGSVQFQVAYAGAISLSITDVTGTGSHLLTSIDLTQVMP